MKEAAKLLKERERCRKKYFESKIKKSKQHLPQHIRLRDSSAQDNTDKETREGSHLANFTRKAVIKIGFKIKYLLDCSFLANFKILDVGCGHGTFLTDISSAFNLHCVGIEANIIHYEASTAFLGHQIRKMKDVFYFPFYPVFGDGQDLQDFGGAEIIYAWIQGAPKDLHQHLFDTFLEDQNAHVFVGDYRELGHKTYRTSLECQMSHGGGSRTLYFYVKTVPMERTRDRKAIKNEDTIENKLRIAFRILTKYRQSSNKTFKNTMEIVSPLLKQGELTKKKRNLERISYKKYY